MFVCKTAKIEIEKMTEDVQVKIFGREMKRTVLVTYLVASLYSTGFFLQTTLLPYITTDLGIDNIHYGYQSTIFAIVQLIGSPIYGRICDRVGVQKALHLAMLSSAVCYILTFFAQDFSLIVVSRLACIFMAGQQGAQTALAAVTTGVERTAAFSRIGITFGSGFILGPLLAGLLSKFFGNRLPLLLCLVQCGICHWLIERYIHIDKVVKEEKEKKSDVKESDFNSLFHLQAYAEVLKNPTVAKLFLMKNLAVTPLIIMTSVFGLFLIEKLQVTPEQNAILGPYIGLTIMFMNAFGVVFLRRKFSDGLLLKIGALVLVWTYGFLAVFSSFFQLFLIMPTMSVGMTLIGVLVDSLLTSSVSQDQHGTVLGMSHAANSLIRVLAPTMGGFMLEDLGFASFGLLGICTSLLALLICFNVDLRNVKNQQETE